MSKAIDDFLEHSHYDVFEVVIDPHQSVYNVIACDYAEAEAIVYSDEFIKMHDPKETYEEVMLPPLSITRKGTAYIAPSRFKI